MTKLRIGIMGCANIAQRTVIPAIKSLSNEYELIAISSRTSEKAQQFAQTFGIIPVVGYDNLLDRTDIDAVYMPLPTGLHHEWISKALDAGKHVIAEKSFAMQYNSALHLVERARYKGLLLMENFMFKYHNQHKTVWDFLQKAEIGNLRLFRSRFGFPPLDENNFRYNKKLGGGSLLDAGAYTIMASRWFLGNNQDVISSVLYVDPIKKVDIYGTVSLKNKNGIVSQLSFGFDNFYQCNYEFWGSEGRIFAQKAFTPKPNEITQIILENQSNISETVINPDNHFIKIFKEFNNCIQNHQFENHYTDILDQSRTISEILAKSLKVSI